MNDQSKITDSDAVTATENEVEIPFDDLEEGDWVQVRWESPHSDEEQTAWGEITDFGEFIDRYGYDDGTPYIEIDPGEADRDLWISPAFGGEVESVTYTTYKNGNARRIGDLVSIEEILEGP